MRAYRPVSLGEIYRAWSVMQCDVVAWESPLERVVPENLDQCE
jgi:hypothetical protein